MAVDPPSLTSQIKKFSGTTWQTKIRLILMQYNVWKIVKRTDPKPQGEVNAAIVIPWNDKNEQVLAIIGPSLNITSILN